MLQDLAMRRNGLPNDLNDLLGAPISYDDELLNEAVDIEELEQPHFTSISSTSIE